MMPALNLSIQEKAKKIRDKSKNQHFTAFRVLMIQGDCTRFISD